MRPGLLQFIPLHPDALICSSAVLSALLVGLCAGSTPIRMYFFLPRRSGPGAALRHLALHLARNAIGSGGAAATAAWQSPGTGGGG